MLAISLLLAVTVACLAIACLAVRRFEQAIDPTMRSLRTLRDEQRLAVVRVRTERDLLRARLEQHAARTPNQ